MLCCTCVESVISLHLKLADSCAPALLCLIAPWQALCFAVLVFGVSNRVLYRMALVPMQDYVFFLAQFQNVRVMKQGERGKGC